jgi:outer membrane protein assembly factor BamA
MSDFFRNDSGVLDPSWRGLEKDWFDHILAFGISRDTRNNENIPLTGSNFSLGGHYHMNDANHDFLGWEGVWTGYYKLGKERYEITVDEERRAGPMNIKKVLKGMEVKRLREQLLNRKVVVLRAYAAQSYEVGGGNRMPTYGLMTLGNDTPLRGYGGSRFRDYTVASVGAEYRFPVMRLLDGMIFNEYGVYGRTWDKINYLGVLKNSWGFGVNVRRPDIHLFRVHLGFHGLHGIQLNLSVDSYY